MDDRVDHDVLPAKPAGMVNVFLPSARSLGLDSRSIAGGQTSPHPDPFAMRFQECAEEDVHQLRQQVAKRWLGNEAVPYPCVLLLY